MHHRNSVRALAVPVLGITAAAVAFALVATADESVPAGERYWPGWRGPLATGEAPHAEPPVEWSEEKNVLWKREIPGKGHASPVIWGDLVFLTTAVESEDPAPEEAQAAAEEELPEWRRGRGVAPERVLEFTLVALDRRDGSVRWQRTPTRALPHEGTHTDGTWASGSPVTDGEVVCAHFGSWGTHCYDLAGEHLWSKDLGDMSTRHAFGEGTSPALAGDALVINWDHEGPSFIVALDKRTGRELWRRERDEVTSWATPLVLEVDGKTQVVVSATNRVRSYELATGQVVWEAAGMTVNTIPSPVAGGGLVYAASGFRGNALLAIRPAGAKGDLTGSDAIVWSHDRDTPYVPSPLLYRGQLYYLKHNKGILTAADATTGERRYQVRLEGIDGAYASPVAAAGRVYVSGRDGTTVVLAHGPEPQVLATNELDDRFDASPALAGDTLYLRGHRHLYALSSEKEAAR